MPRLENKTGMKFGRLAVISRGLNLGSKVRWLCVCECGKQVQVDANSLAQGLTTSCGCARFGANHATHRRTNTPEYHSWSGIKQRCLNPRSHAFENYGARGIKVCQQWIDSFEQFLADVGSRPGVGYSIDRIDNDGNYEPGNVRWATASEQSNNQRARHRRANCRRGHSNWYRANESGRRCRTCNSLAHREYLARRPLKY